MTTSDVRAGLRYDIIATGSQGNGVVIGDEILIDCGVSWKALGPYWRRLKLVLLTHWHSDHFNPATVRRLAAERPTLRWGCCAWMVSRLLQAGVSPHNIDRYVRYSNAVYKDWVTLTAITLDHDVPNCGYILHMLGGSMIYATDTSTLEGVEAPDLDLYLLEANHISDEIRQRIAEKQAAGEYPYEERALRTHLSLEQCHEFFYNQGGPHSVLVPMHCHVDKEVPDDAVPV